ncbi:MAG: tetratricopeptide repeat protein [Pseudomonadota bacterium]
MDTIKKLLRLTCLVAFLIIGAGCSDQTKQDSLAYQQGIDAYAKSNYAVALEKFKPLAERGIAQAQFNLGVMYRQGQGVPQDDKTAVMWWTKAAEQGHVEAQDNLGLRYGRGQGVAQDWVQAYKWFSLAAAAGNETAKGNQHVAETKMTPQQVAQAQDLVQEWQAKHKK